MRIIICNNFYMRTIIWSTIIWVSLHYQHLSTIDPHIHKVQNFISILKLAEFFF